MSERDQLIERIATELGKSVYAGSPGRERDAWLRTYARTMLDTVADYLDEQADARRLANGHGPYLWKDEVRMGFMYLAAVMRGRDAHSTVREPGDAANTEERP